MCALPFKLLSYLMKVKAKSDIRQTRVVLLNKEEIVKEDFRSRDFWKVACFGCIYSQEISIGKKYIFFSILSLRREGPAVETEVTQVLTRCLSQRTCVNARYPFLFDHLEHLEARCLWKESGFYVISYLCWYFMNMTYKLLIEDRLGKI